MNWAAFGIIGHLGLLLTVGAVLLWLVYWKLPRKLISRVALGLAIGAMLCAMLNSATHVNRIQIDPEIARAKMEALEEAKRQAMLDSRGEDVANIRFVEDASGEYLDTAGMDEADLQYMQKLQEGTPAWRKGKKERSVDGGGDDDSLDALIDDEEQEGGADVADLDETAAPEPILMSEADMVRANRIDHLNLDLTQWLFLFGVVVLGYDYLRRTNLYREATFPLPLPSSWPRAVTPLEPIVERPSPPRRPVPAELAWLARRGDSFVYLTDDPEKAGVALAAVPDRGHGVRRREVLRVDPQDRRMTDDFVFEALWFGRGSFVIDSKAHADRLMERFLILWEERRATRARSRGEAHVVWDLRQPVPEALRHAFVDFAGPAGFSLFVLEPQNPSS